MIGKRELMVIWGEPAFIPFDSPDNPLSADLLQLNHTDIPGFIQDLAHEVTHMSNFVGTSTRSAQTLQAEIQSGIQEEIQTRQSETTILGEIRNPDVQARASTVGSRDPAVVEREIPPAFALTYLELFSFSRRLRDAQATDGITDDQAAEIRERVEQSELIGLVYPWGRTYGRVWLDRWRARQEWREFLRQNRRTDPNFEQRKEVLLQEHARRFFRGLVSYRPLPQTVTTP